MRSQASQASLNLPLKANKVSRKPPIKIRHSQHKLKNEGSRNNLNHKDALMIEEQSEKRTFDMGTQAIVDDQDLVMPEILAFDGDGIPPSESFGDGEFSPLQ